MTAVYLNRIATALPPHEVHGKFLDYAPRMLPDPRARRLLERMAARAGIEERWSVLTPHPDPERLDLDEQFRRGAFPGTKGRMALYEAHAPALAAEGVAALALRPEEQPTHLVLTSCTGFHAPGMDIDLVRRLGLDPSVERTIVGFMGCSAAINGLKTAWHIVRSDPAARVLVVNVELCTLHLQETEDLEALLSFMIFADGCAASLVSAEPSGAEMLGFTWTVIPGSDDEITWRIGDQGFDMHLAGTVPTSVGRALPRLVDRIYTRCRPDAVSLWAVHPGGRSILDAAEQALDLPTAALDASREVLRRHGNMSSPTVMFVLQALMRTSSADRTGLAMAFGPGLTAETMLFKTTGCG